MAKSFDLIVFDWDGTLMDSLGTIVDCAQAALRDLELPPAEENAIRDLVGLRLDTIAARLLASEDAGPAEQRRWIERYSYHWRNTFYGDLRPLPAAPEVLAGLEERRQMMAVATGKSRRGLDHDFETTGFGRYFASSRTVDESPAKPNPHMLFELMEELGTRAESTLMVGDTTHDIGTARNAGVEALGVLTGSHDRRRLLEHGAVACVESVGDLIPWLDAG
ncbi:MAG: HAD-IA family hydrolase [Acidobacteriota bacterium]